MTFDLLREAWIPVADQEGQVKEYGILETLGRAHELVEIVDPAPPIQFGLYRFLIAFVMDALQLRELEDLQDLLLAGRFDPAALLTYTQTVAKDCFDLFHPTKPFLQVAPSPDATENSEPVTVLFRQLPSGGFAIHFHHLDSAQQAFSPAVCARGLLTIAPFMTAGGRGYAPSLNGNPPWYVLLKGRSLFETIVLNCCVPDTLGLRGANPPAWRSPDPVVAGRETDCLSVLEGLTWRPRRVTLLPGEGGDCTYTGRPSPLLVRRILFRPGLMFRGTGWTDPQVAYRETDKGRSPLRPTEDRELWRDTGPLMLLRRQDFESEKGHVRYSRPAVMDQSLELKRFPEAALGQQVIEVYGIRTDGKMKVFEWQRERLALPQGVMANPRAGAQLQRAMEMAEKVAYSLSVGLKKAYPRDGEGNQKALDSLVAQAQAGFWTALRPRFEDELLPRLATQDPDDLDAVPHLLGDWRTLLTEVGWASLESALGGLDADAKALRRQVAARDTFARMLGAGLKAWPDGAQEPERKEG